MEDFFKWFDSKPELVAKHSGLLQGFRFAEADVMLFYIEIGRHDLITDAFILNHAYEREIVMKFFASTGRTVKLKGKLKNSLCINPEICDSLIGKSLDSTVPVRKVYLRYASDETWVSVYHRDPSNPGSIYHNADHSNRVAQVAEDLTIARGLTDADSKIFRDVETKAKFVREVSLLHDIDPNRAIGTPARVEETIKWMSSEEGKALIDKFRWTPDQELMAIYMIRRTQFPLDENAIGKLRESLLKISDPALRKFALIEGAILSEYADKASWYMMQGFDDNFDVVKGLANEINSNAGKTVTDVAGLKSDEFLGSIGKDSSFNIDNQLAKEFEIVLSEPIPLLDDVLDILPLEFRRNLENTIDGFKKYRQIIEADKSLSESVAKNRALDDLADEIISNRVCIDLGASVLKYDPTEVDRVLRLSIDEKVIYANDELGINKENLREDLIDIHGTKPDGEIGTRKWTLREKAEYLKSKGYTNSERSKIFRSGVGGDPKIYWESDFITLNHKKYFPGNTITVRRYMDLGDKKAVDILSDRNEIDSLLQSLGFLNADGNLLKSLENFESLRGPLIRDELKLDGITELSKLGEVTRSQWSHGGLVGKDGLDDSIGLSLTLSSSSGNVPGTPTIYIEFEIPVDKIVLYDKPLSSSVVPTLFNKNNPSRLTVQQAVDEGIIIAHPGTIDGTNPELEITAIGKINRNIIKVTKIRDLP
jgi:hypothetical protein